MIYSPSAFSGRVSRGGSWKKGICQRLRTDGGKSPSNECRQVYVNLAPGKSLGSILKSGPEPFLSVARDQYAIIFVLSISVPVFANLFMFSYASAGTNSKSTRTLFGEIFIERVRRSRDAGRDKIEFESN